MANVQSLDCFRKKIELKEALEEMLAGVFPCKLEKYIFKIFFRVLN